MTANSPKKYFLDEGTLVRFLWLLAAFLLLPARILAQEPLSYRAEYSLSQPSQIHVTLRILHRVFRAEELPAIFRDATGVDTKNILDRWLQPLAP